MSKYYEKVSPESVGIPSAAIRRFLSEIEAQTIPMHSFMIARHGKVCA